MTRALEAYLEGAHMGRFARNADGNTRFIYDEGSIELAPLYDAVPVLLYPEIDQHLAMKIGGAQFARQVGRSHWRKLAEKTGLDADRTVAVAIQVGEAAAARAGSAWAGLSGSQSNRIEQAALKTAATFARTTTR